MLGYLCLMANFWFKFEWDAWLADRPLHRCSFETRGFWIECICLMEEAGECFIDGTPDEVANLLGCSIEVLRRCVGDLKRTGAAEVTATKDYVKILSRRLLKRFNLREYNRIKQAEYRRQSNVNDVSIECQDAPSKDLESKSLREEEKTVGADSPNGEIAQPKAKRRPKAGDLRKEHAAIKTVHEILTRWPHKDLWDRIIREVGDSPDVAFLRSSYERWRSVDGNPMNLEKWLFDPLKTGELPVIYGAKNGISKQIDQPAKTTNVQRMQRYEGVTDKYVSEKDLGGVS
jgi:hypothetical protein